MSPCAHRAQSGLKGYYPLLALQTVFLTLHVFDDDVVDLAQRSGVFQQLPRLVGVEVDLDRDPRRPQPADSRP